MTLEDAINALERDTLIFHYDVDYRWPMPPGGANEYQLRSRRQCPKQIVEFLPRRAHHDTEALHQFMDLLPLGGRYTGVRLRATDQRLLRHLEAAWDDLRQMKLIMTHAALKDLLGDSTHGSREWQKANNRVGRELLYQLYKDLPSVRYHHACNHFLPRPEKGFWGDRIVPPQTLSDWVAVATRQVNEVFISLDLCRITIHTGLEDGASPSG